MKSLFRITVLATCCLYACAGISQDQWVFIGTYTQKGSYGIYVAKLSTNTGALTLVDSVKADNPSYLALNKATSRLYAVSENGGTNPGAVASYSVDFQTGKMTFLNQQPSGGDHPCYVSVNSKGTHVLAANYSGGNFGVLPLDKDGQLLPPSQVIQHYGAGPDKARQSKPHMHTAIFAPKEKYAVVADLGTDYVKGYPFDARKQAPIDTSKVIGIKLTGGSGPRHISFHPTLPVFYVMEEMSGKISVHAFMKKRIALLQTIACDKISKAPGSADIHVSPDGKYVYATNRAEANNIGIFETDPSTGRLGLIGFQSTLGANPRNFTLDPTGNFLLVANQNTHNIVVFRRDAQTGRLSETGHTLSVSMPVCLVIPGK